MTWKLSEAPGTLWHICLHQYFPRKARLRSGKTRDQYDYAFRSFAEHLGRDPMPSDLDDDVLIGWLNSLLMRGLAVPTVREKIGRIGALWRWMAKRRLIDRWPTFELPECPDPIPVALSQEQVAKLFEAAHFEPGIIAGIPARLWWEAFLAFVFCTSERKSAALALRWEWINFERRIAVIPPQVRKGRKKAGIYPLWPEVMPLLERIRQPSRDLVFPFDKCEGTYFKRYARLLRRAGLPDGRKFKTHCLRVTHATWKKVFGGDPTRALMHSDAATTERHYLDKTYLPQENMTLFTPWTEPQEPAFVPPAYAFAEWIG